MQAKVFWVPGPWRGRLGILPRPRGGDWLSDETATWRAAGVDMVVSLLEAEEEAEMILEGEAAAAAASGIEFRALPIPDRGVPASRESVAELADDIVDALDMGKNVAVHCRQGIGRSGLIVGGVLVAAGKDVPAALRTIKESRGLDVPETEEQQRWLREFSSWLPTQRTANRPLPPTSGGSAVGATHHDRERRSRLSGRTLIWRTHFCAHSTERRDRPRVVLHRGVSPRPWF